MPGRRAPIAPRPSSSPHSLPPLVWRDCDNCMAQTQLEALWIVQLNLPYFRPSFRPPSIDNSGRSFRPRASLPGTTTWSTRAFDIKMLDPGFCLRFGFQRTIGSKISTHMKPSMDKAQAKYSQWKTRYGSIAICGPCALLWSFSELRTVKEFHIGQWRPLQSTWTT